MHLLTNHQGEEVRKKIGAYKYLECSARTNEGVREVFEHATRAAMLKKEGKKNKKSNNSPSATPSEGKFNLSIGIIEQLAKINVNAPASQADVPAVVKTLQEKLEFWKKDQDRKTKEVSISHPLPAYSTD